MATFRNVSGRWQVQVRRAGVYSSRTFQSRRDAEEWAHRIEAPLIAASRAHLAPEGSLHAFGAVLERYEAVVIPRHRSKSAYGVLKHLHRHWLMGVPCAELNTVHMAAYRDERLRQVKASTVEKAFALMRPMIDVATREWGAAFVGNPAREVKVRVGEDSRKGRLSPERWQELIEALRRRRNKEVARVVEMALETSMRRGELLSLRWEDIDLEAGTAFLSMTKNGHSRTVALSPRALELLLEGRTRKGQVFNTTVESVRSMFQRVRKELGINDICFHMTRHEAISRMWEMGLNDIEISNQSGHKDLRMLRRYSEVDWFFWTGPIVNL